MRHLIWIIFVAITVSLGSSAVDADEGVVVKKFGSCDYFIADGPRGLYVLEWYGGYDPDEGDSIIGDIGSYGMKNVIYNSTLSGRVWVEDFLESSLPLLLFGPTDSLLTYFLLQCPTVVSLIS